MNIMVFRIKDGDFAGWADWDCAPHDGDKAFADSVLADDRKSVALSCCANEREVYYRPADAEAWRAHGERWSKLADLLASDPELWVYTTQ